MKKNSNVFNFVGKIVSNFVGKIFGNKIKFDEATIQSLKKLGFDTERNPKFFTMLKEGLKLVGIQRNASDQYEKYKLDVSDMLTKWEQLSNNLIGGQDTIRDNIRTMLTNYLSEASPTKRPTRVSNASMLASFIEVQLKVITAENFNEKVVSWLSNINSKNSIAEQIKTLQLDRIISLIPDGRLEDIRKSKSKNNAITLQTINPKTSESTWTSIQHIIGETSEINQLVGELKNRKQDELKGKLGSAPSNQDLDNLQLKNMDGILTDKCKENTSFGGAKKLIGINVDKVNGLNITHLEKVTSMIEESEVDVVTLDLDQTLIHKGKHFFSDFKSKLDVWHSQGFNSYPEDGKISMLFSKYNNTWKSDSEDFVRARSDLLEYCKKHHNRLSLDTNERMTKLESLTLFADLEILDDKGEILTGKEAYKKRLDLLCKAEVGKVGKVGEGYWTPDMIVKNYFGNEIRQKAITTLFEKGQGKGVLVAVASHGVTPKAIQAMLFKVFSTSLGNDEKAEKLLSSATTMINESTVRMHGANRSKGFHISNALNYYNSEMEGKDEPVMMHIDDNKAVIADIGGRIRYSPPKPESPEITEKYYVNLDTLGYMRQIMEKIKPSFVKDQMVESDKNRYFAFELTDEQLRIMEMNGFNLNNKTITYEPMKTAGDHLAKSHDEKMLDIIKSAGYLENINPFKLGGKVGVDQDHMFNPVESLRSTIEEKLKSKFHDLYPQEAEKQVAEKTKLVMEIADVLAVHGFEGFQTQTMGDIDLRLTSKETLNSNIQDLRSYLEEKGDTKLLFAMLSETGFQGGLDGSVIAANHAVNLCKSQGFINNIKEISSLKVELYNDGPNNIGIKIKQQGVNPKKARFDFSKNPLIANSVEKLLKQLQEQYSPGNKFTNG